MKKILFTIQVFGLLALFPLSMMASLNRNTEKKAVQKISLADIEKEGTYYPQVGSGVADISISYFMLK
jgi:hypothetical protein